MKRKCRTQLVKIRQNLCSEYHNLSDVLTTEECYPNNTEKGEVGAAFDMVSDAINCLNRELGLNEDS